MMNYLYHIELSHIDSQIAEFAINNPEISIEYDCGGELIDNYVKWDRSVNFLKSKN